MPQLRSTSFRCRGHPDIRGSHHKSVEFTRDGQISARATCVLGVGADFDPDALAGFRGPVAVTITVGTRTDVLRAVANPRFEPGGTAVIRTSRHASTDTLAVAADKGADGLDRELVAELARPGAPVTVTIAEQPATGRPGPGEFTALWLPELRRDHLAQRLREVALSSDVLVGEHASGLRELFAQAGLDREVDLVAAAGTDVEALRARLQAGEHVAYVAVSGGPEAEPNGTGGPLARSVEAALDAGAAARVLPPPPLELAALVAAGPRAGPYLLTGPDTPDRRIRAELLDAAAGMRGNAVWRECPSSLAAALDEIGTVLDRCSVRVWVQPSSPQALLLGGTPAEVARQWDALGQPPGEVIVHVRPTDTGGPSASAGSAGAGAAAGGAGGQLDGLLTALLDQGVSTRTLARALATLPGREYRGEYRRILRLKSRDGQR